MGLIWEFTLVETQVQAKNPSDQEMHRHPDREGVPGETGWTEGHLQLPRLGPGGDQEMEGLSFLTTSANVLRRLAIIAKNVHS